MTITVEAPDGSFTVEYAGVIVRVKESPIYRLVAPDNTTVDTYDSKPSAATAKQALADAGYEVPENSKVPFRNLEIPAEGLPGNLSI